VQTELQSGLTQDEVMPNPRPATLHCKWRRLFSVLAGTTILAAVVIGLSAIGTPVLGAGSASIQEISVDPYTNSTSQHQTEVEPGMFAFASTLVAAFQAGRFFSAGGSSNVGWATSTDAGATWVNGFLPGLTVFSTPTGSASRATDPAVGYDRKTGTWLIVTLVCAPPPDACNTAQNSVEVSRSSDGVNWGSPVIVHTGDDDKEWVACDNTPSSPFYGHCYVSWNDFGVNQTRTSVSVNGGATWGTGVQTIQMSGVQPLAQPDGTLIIVGDGNNDLVSVRSTDGGVTYGAPVMVANLQSHSPTGMRAPALPSAAMDAQGKLYVTWADCRFQTNCSSNDIVISTSTDGITWSGSPARVPIDAIGSGVDHFIPGLGIDPATSGSSASLGLAYYYLPVASCALNACQLNVGYVSSDDGGSTWTVPTQMNAQTMSLSWLANTDWPGRMVGDYISTVSSSGQFRSIFALASAPSGPIFDESMWVGTVVAPSPTPTPTPSPNCPSGTPPPWPVPAGDSDCDGFPDSVPVSGKTSETNIGTDPTRSCAATAAPDDELSADAMPPDFNDDQIINGQDTGKFGGPFGSFNKLVSQGPFGPLGNQLPGERFDFNGNGAINGQDTGKYQAYYNKTCA
jgi:hypothetical protein